MKAKSILSRISDSNVGCLLKLKLQTTNRSKTIRPFMLNCRDPVISQSKFMWELQISSQHTRTKIRIITKFINYMKNQKKLKIKPIQIKNTDMLNSNNYKIQKNNINGRKYSYSVD